MLDIAALDIAVQRICSQIRSPIAFSEELSISGMPTLWLSQQHVEILADAIQDNHHITKLRVEDEIDDWGITILDWLLRSGTTAIQSLYLHNTNTISIEGAAILNKLYRDKIIHNGAIDNALSHQL